MIENVQLVRLGNDEFSKFSHPYIWIIKPNQKGRFGYCRNKRSDGEGKGGDDRMGLLSNELAILGALVSNYQIRFFGVHDSRKGAQDNLFRLSSDKNKFFLYKGSVDIKALFSPFKEPDELTKEELLTEEELEKIGLDAFLKLERAYQSIR